MHSMCENENIPMCGKRIDYFRIPHNTLLLPPKLILHISIIVFKNAVLPGSFENNGLCKNLGGKQSVL